MMVSLSSASSLDDALVDLARVDARIDQVSSERPSLDPDPRRATTLVELAHRHVVEDGPVARAYVAGLARVGAAQVDAFPENLFWDFDAFAGSVHRQAIGSESPIALLEEVSGIACRLMVQYGGLSPIRFRYVHDFMYGFDWARWVARAPDERSHVGPFDMPFLRYVSRRGSEIIELIAGDDETYGKLEDGRHRNPFGFSREPEDERRLFVDLSERNLVPVPAWKTEASASWDRPYQELREERARALGIAY